MFLMKMPIEYFPISFLTIENLHHQHIIFALISYEIYLQLDGHILIGLLENFGMLVTNLILCSRKVNTEGIKIEK